MREGGRRGAEAAVRALLRAMGEDPDRPGLRETPARVRQAMEELFLGVGQDPAAAIAVAAGAEGEDVGQEVAVEAIPFLSWCEHHLLPFYGSVDVRYAPAGGRLAGLGDLARAVAIASRRPQLQERMTAEIADALMRALAPAWVEVRAHATQLCLVARGANAAGARVETVARRGRGA
ncbi:MAG: GTP cyclohydrolase I FolE [Firmicutes bacterium]|nr:GTP cyclohydrolase I FolE [Bacillota bacterium]